ncbi:tyrosine-protein phosphatase [Runella slithyformis]|uniref:protein-tyrosine-phosphatase n=1 Tax=Runella slithyformis (strain ATCC 29530 / DSM 19594 / LMG 11500 / NCIMB 11436 / LSU 4) TaxID=761193 RepID=A0A7U3ZIT2_RUNSL|nr:CpsB/CapC family capsule biosynthesis tyrosine phosphatase [Runella slithyformis]AEI47920.1 PHP domain protein [Runella slithyformis DSM 19594]
MALFSFLKGPKSNPSLPLSLASLESDWHCHVLPGIDDGCQNEAQSLEMLLCYTAMGIKKIVATPHVRADFYKNTHTTISAAFQKVQHLIQTHNLPLLMEASAEYYADENFFQLITENQLMPIDNQYILFELPMQNPGLWGTKMIEMLQKKGYTPLLAHPERYRYWHNKPQEWSLWKNTGVCFQLNLLSLTGYYGAAERRAAEQLLEADYIDAVGTDAHGVRHLQKLNELTQNSLFDNLQQLPLLNRLG